MRGRGRHIIKKHNLNKIRSDNKMINQLEKSIDWQKKNNLSIKNDKNNRVGNSKILTNIRKRRFQKTQRMLNRYKDIVSVRKDIDKNIDYKEKRERGIAKTRKALINAKKQYNKDYNSAYNFSASHPISQFAGYNSKPESDNRWNKAFESGKNLTRAERAYKRAKRY